MRIEITDNRIKFKVAQVVFFLLALFYIFFFSLTVRAEGNTYDDADKAAAYVRSQIMARESDIRIKYEFNGRSVIISSDKYDEIFSAYNAENYDEVSRLIADIIDKNIPEVNVGWPILRKATAHTGKGNEGDYLINSIKDTFTVSSSPHCVFTPVDGNSYEMEVDNVNLRYGFEYYTSAQQEQSFKNEAAKTMNSLKLSGLTDYEKVCRIYSYIAQNITYDRENVNNDAYGLKQSAYAALVNKTAVCQGYASLMYYMLNSQDIDCRIIKGSSKNQSGKYEHHAWNMVLLDGKYYFIDSTWDAESTDYRYFLLGKNSNELNNDHITLGLDYISDETTYLKPEDVYDNIASDTYYAENGNARNDISQGSLTVTNATYDDGIVSADITVTYGGKTLIRGIDYTVSYGIFKIQEGSSIGSIDVSVTGKGMYQATLTRQGVEMVDISSDGTGGGQAVSGDSGQPQGSDTQIGGGTTEKIVTGEAAGNSSIDEDDDEDEDDEDDEDEDDEDEDDVIVRAKFSGTIRKGGKYNIGGFRYQVTGTGSTGTLTICSALKKNATLVIPDAIEINGKLYKVTAISASAFSKNSKLKKVTVGRYVNTIGKKAFFNCKNLKTIVFKGASLKKVGAQAFKNTAKKAKVTTPGKVSKIKKLLQKSGLNKNAKVSS